VSVVAARRQLAAAKLEWGALHWALADYNLLLLRAGNGDEYYPDLLSGKAFALNALGEPREALDLNRIALGRYSLMNNHRRIADTLNNIGACYKHLGAYPNGIAAGLESIELRSNDPLSIYTMVEIAELSLLAGDPAQADDHVCRARGLIARSSMHHEEALAIMVLEAIIHHDSLAQLLSRLTGATSTWAPNDERLILQFRRALETAIGLNRGDIASNVLAHMARWDLAE
jgi:tetratricopeptide (TPR) repeat protein